MSDIEEREETTEWRVKTDQTVDDFGVDEEDAREWLAYCQSRQEWRPATLMRRSVVTENTAWEAV